MLVRWSRLVRGSPVDASNTTPSPSIDSLDEDDASEHDAKPYLEKPRLLAYPQEVVNDMG